MTKDKALKLALEILHYLEALNSDTQRQKMEAITAIKQALAAPVQEPVGEVCGYYERGFDAEKTRYGKLYNQDLPLGIKLYTAPPNMATPPAAQRQWQGLTDEEKQEWIDAMPYTIEPRHCMILINVMEAKLKEKNT